MSAVVTVVGAGLAGSEVALCLASRGIDVRLIEMKPARRTPAQTSDAFCELVCSNSLRGAALTNAVGLLKEEMRRLGSFVIAAADRTRVPAGGALAVDRERFSAAITHALQSHPRIHIEHRELEELPEERPLVLATGPLTSEALSRALERVIGGQHLAYYDAIAPIVAADSIDESKVFRASRWGKGEIDASTGEGAPPDEALSSARPCAEGAGDGAYVNCPFDEAGYFAFVRALCEAEKVAPRAFEDARYFEGCLPIEVMAERGERTLAFGPMKPAGLVDPRTGRWPFAVVQLRAEDEAMSAYNLVGFQTRLKIPEQQRIFRMIPGLEQAEFFRYGSVHRNTFVDGPRVLGPGFELRALPGVYLAGQITGVEGYVESAASGLLCAIGLARALAGEAPLAPPTTTALGGLLEHVLRGPAHGGYQPSNITFSHLAPLDPSLGRLKKRARYEALAQRALGAIDAFVRSVGRAEPGPSFAPQSPRGATPEAGTQAEGG